MFTRAKKIKLDEDEVEKTNLTKILPSEVIEKIVSFVPSKLNCFLVSKDFQREAINATRNKCILNLNPTNLLSEVLINTQWAFDEIRLADDIWISSGKTAHSRRKSSLNMNHYRITGEVFKKFGSQIKKFSIFNMRIRESDLFRLLAFMPNLVELHIENCRPAYNLFDRSTPRNNIAELGKLEKLTLITMETTFLERISCPTIQDLCVRNTYDHSLSVQGFHQRHTQIKKIELGDLYLTKISLDHLQLSKLSLTHRTTSEEEISSIIESQPNLKLLSLAIYNLFTDELLQKVVMLQQLESLDIFIDNYRPISKPLIEEMMHMRRLKSLKIRTDNSDFIKTLLEVTNVRIEELSLDKLVSYRSNTFNLGEIAENFPNLKKLSLNSFKIRGNGFNKLLQLKKLKSIMLHYSSFDESAFFSETNISIRELAISNYRYVEVIKLLILMPNIERLTIYSERYLSERRVSEQREIIEAALKLKSLQELKSDLSFFECKEVTKFILEHQENTKLERIIIRDTFDRKKCSAENVCAAYKAQFPVIHIDHKKSAQLTMSRM